MFRADRWSCNKPAGRLYSKGVKKSLKKGWSMKIIKMLLLAVPLLYAHGNYARAIEGELKDGTYQGEHAFVRVEVTVVRGKMQDISVVEHGGGGAKYAEMIQPLTGEMVEKATTEVDAVTGATVSSEHFKKAVEDALGKARGSVPS
jgi:uncharacterized protein with FMN-binding domain